MILFASKLHEEVNREWGETGVILYSIPVESLSLFYVIHTEQTRVNEVEKQNSIQNFLLVWPE